MSKNAIADRTGLKNWLVNNPKALSALWALVLLLVEVGPVLADGSGSGSGP